MNSGITRTLSTLSLGLVVALTSCGSVDDLVPAPASATPAAASESASPTAAGSITPSPTASPTGTPESPSASPSATDEAPPSSEPSQSDGGPTVVKGADRTLLLTDAFSAGSWEQGNFTPVGSTEEAQALAVEVGCNSSEPEVLEFRFSGTDGYTFKADIAQELYSETATASLEFALVVDGRQKATKTIKFKEKGQLSADLTGVAVVRLTVKHPDGTDEECNGEIRALVTQLVMTSQ